MLHEERFDARVDGGLSLDPLPARCLPRGLCLADACNKETPAYGEQAWDEAQTMAVAP